MTDNEAVKAYKQVIDYCSQHDDTCETCIFYDSSNEHCLIEDEPFVNERRYKLLYLIKGVEE